MNLSQLYYFKRLAELKHYTNTAKELFITQPTLSDAISGLEKELQEVLFKKEGRNIRLTNAGREFYECVCRTLNELDSGINSIKGRKLAVGGKIELACIPTLLSNFLPDAVNSYISEKNNTVKINIYSAHSHQIAKKIQDDEYDLGFCAMQENMQDLVFVPILYQRYIVILREGHELAQGKCINLESLRGYNIITYRKEISIGKTLYSYIDKYKLNMSYEYDDEISIGGMVEATNCVGIVAATSYLKLFDNIYKLNIDGLESNKHTIYMVYKKKKYISKAVESFADFVMEKKLKLTD